ncbi:MAG TPA: ABC transporter ATP-binding protein [Acidimicrobiales bacterium]|nr:ABC transporter ATP-binding protein [Acidimicrobiales bacterium]
MGWGPPAGSPFAGAGANATNAASGLPFAGIPSELRERVERELEHEPEHPAPEVEFHHVDPDPRPFTLRTFLQPHLGALVVAAVLVIVETVALTAGPFITRLAIDEGITPGEFDTLLAISLVYLASIVVNALAGRARIAFTGTLGERLMEQLRIRVFSHLQRLPLGFYTEEKAGRLMTRMTSDIDALTQLFQEGLVQLAVQALTLAIITGVLIALDPLMAAVTLLLVVPAMFGLTLWFRSASDRGYAAVRDRIADVMADLQEGLSGVRIITAHNRRRHNVVHHRNVVGAYRDANDYTAKVGAIYGPSTEAIGVVGQAVILLVGGRLVLDGRISLGDLFAFTLYLTMFFAPIQQIVQLYNQYQQGQAAAAKLRDLLGTPSAVVERADARELPPIAGGIVLEGVTFGYDPAAPVLRDVDLEIRPGETFALVGPTGAGKSTVAKLVTRFYDPQSGRVLVDGHDVRDVTLRSLRGQIGVVPQEPFLFHGSIRDNVAFGRPDASDDDVREACRAVGIDDLVDRMPDGLDTPCHERGVSLSSGERQLLALARTFLYRPRVVVLDEATSNLDLQSETKVEAALDVLLDGRTAIVIAHRLSTAQRADRIAVIDDGGVVELGTHDELVVAGGRYAAMWATYASHLGEERTSSTGG